MQDEEINNGLNDDSNIYLDDKVVFGTKRLGSANP